RVLVTNAVGMGIVPESRLARHFRDIAGRVNQQLAAAANDEWLVFAGMGVKIKGVNYFGRCSLLLRVYLYRVAGPRAWISSNILAV
ncbi:hypothetical protein FGG77_24425, partial [Escherichia coli]